MAIVIAAALFGSLEAMREGWGFFAAVAVRVGIAVSVLPILLRILPPITPTFRPVGRILVDGSRRSA